MSYPKATDASTSASATGAPSATPTAATPKPPGSSAMPMVPMIPQGPNHLGPVNLPVTCNFCHKTVITSTRPVAGLMVWGSCLLLLLLGGFLGFSLVPFCITDCHDIEHTCPACGVYIGTYKRI